jgi:hypothetical protein
VRRRKGGNKESRQRRYLSMPGESHVHPRAPQQQLCVGGSTQARRIHLTLGPTPRGVAGVAVLRIAWARGAKDGMARSRQV